jgi:hypothetical protein
MSSKRGFVYMYDKFAGIIEETVENSLLPDQMKEKYIEIVGERLRRL